MWEAVERLLSHHEIHIEGGLMLIVGGIGLGVNIVAALCAPFGFEAQHQCGRGLQACYADLMGSVGVVISGVIVI